MTGDGRISRRGATVGLLMAAGLTMTVTVATVGCGRTAPAENWAGGPVSPDSVIVTFNPSAMPVGDTMATGVVIDDHEMVLYFWGGGAVPYLDTAWRDVRTAAVRPELPGGWMLFFGDAYPDMLDLRQFVAPDGTLVEYGAVRGPVARVVCDVDGTQVEARFAQWSADSSVTVFWLRRSGQRIPDNSPSGIGITVPLAPQMYPLITAFDAAGAVIGSARLRPSATAQKGAALASAPQRAP